MKPAKSAGNGESSTNLTSLDVLLTSAMQAAFTKPQFELPSAWSGHIPVMFSLMTILKPRVFVELGVHHGASFFAACQAVQQMNLTTQCFGIDHWEGDPHAGEMGDDVYDAAKSVLDTNFSSFASFVRKSFDQAVADFDDESIDLLHIDGYHSYEAVSGDFNMWKRKLSKRSIVIFHDVNEYRGSFGAWRFWREVSREFDGRAYALGNDHGLGVLFFGDTPSEAVAQLLNWLQKHDGFPQVQTFFAELSHNQKAWGAVGGSLSREKQKIREDNDVLRNRVKEREEALAKSNDVNKASTQKISQLEVEVKSFASEKASLLTESQTLLSRVEELAARLGAVEAERDGLVVERDGVVLELERLRGEQDTLAAEVSRLVGERDGWRRQARLERERFSNLELSFRAEKESTWVLHQALEKQLGLLKQHEAELRQHSRLLRILLSRRTTRISLLLADALEVLRFRPSERPSIRLGAVSKQLSSPLSLVSRPEVALTPVLGQIPQSAEPISVAEEPVLQRPDDPILAGAFESLTALREGRYSQAEAGFLAMRHARGGNYDSAKKLSKTGEPSDKYFDEVGPKHPPSGRGPERVVIYSGLFGRYDSIAPAPSLPNADFVLFTDDEHVVAPGWIIRQLPRGNSEVKFSPEALNRQVKINPHLFFPEYSYSLYVDANLSIDGNVMSLIRNRVRDLPLVAFAHPERSSAFDEIEAVLLRGKGRVPALIEQWKFFREQGLPDSTGMIEARFMWRAHHDPSVRMLMEEWWKTYERFLSRDQPALAFAMWKTGVRPRVLPNEFGDSRKNHLFGVSPHLHLDTSCQPSNTGRVYLSPRLRNVPLVFLRRENYSTRVFPSDQMRVDELAQIVRKHSKKISEVEVIGAGGAETIKNSLVILSKRHLAEASREQIEKLRSKGNMLVADYVDGVGRGELTELFDAHIACGISQLHNYRDRFGNDSTFLITHHASNFPSGPIEDSKKFQVAYVGEPENLAHHAEMTGVLDILPTSEGQNYTNLKNRWAMHLTVRRQRQIDGFKPYTKGFYAAWSGAVVLESADNLEARWYLGADYPFLSQSSTLEDVISAIQQAEACFETPVWEEAQEVMASLRDRSSERRISKEVEWLWEWACGEFRG